MDGRLARRQINTSVHESCSPHTPKTIAGGLCAGRAAEFTVCTHSLLYQPQNWRWFSEQGFKRGSALLCAARWGLIVRQSSKSLHEKQKAKHVATVMFSIHQRIQESNITQQTGMPLESTQYQIHPRYDVNKAWVVYSALQLGSLKCSKRAQG